MSSYSHRVLPEMSRANFSFTPLESDTVSICLNSAASVIISSHTLRLDGWFVKSLAQSSNSSPSKYCLKTTRRATPTRNKNGVPSIKNKSHTLDVTFRGSTRRYAVWSQLNKYTDGSNPFSFNSNIFLWTLFECSLSATLKIS